MLSVVIVVEVSRDNVFCDESSRSMFVLIILDNWWYKCAHLVLCASERKFEFLFYIHIVQINSTQGDHS